jgi:hypothetical protein
MGGEAEILSQADGFMRESLRNFASDAVPIGRYWVLAAKAIPKGVYEMMIVRLKICANGPPDYKNNPEIHDWSIEDNT